FILYEDEINIEYIRLHFYINIDNLNNLQHPAGRDAPRRKVNWSTNFTLFQQSPMPQFLPIFQVQSIC
ncbi:MAG: hypothetical protein KAS58_00210, partial [Calditrichia bacterium]|nr:hypothetical protein [Calditrichia bacterium]